MLRLFVLVLILANGLYLAWSQGWLRTQGFAPTQQSEPQRMTQQIRPEAVRILTPAEHKKVLAQVQADLEPKQCLSAGPFDTAQVNALDQALAAALPPGGWQFESITTPEHWIIYMGKFANAEALEKKRSELAVLKLVPQLLHNPSLEIGLSLGGYDTQAAATAELAKLTQRGIRTARVVQERAAGNATYLKLPAVTEAMKQRLNDVKPALAGQTLKACS
jgi:hypothetical protein